MGVVAGAVGVGRGARVGVAEGATVGVAVGNSATDVAVGAGAHVVNSEMLRLTIKSKDLMFLFPLLLVFTLCRVFCGKILFDASPNRIAFHRCQVTIFAVFEVSQFQRPDGDPHQPQHTHVQRF